MTRRTIVSIICLILLVSLPLIGIEVAYRIEVYGCPLDELTASRSPSTDLIRSAIWAAWNGSGPPEIRALWPWTEVVVDAQLVLAPHDHVRTTPDLEILEVAALLTMLKRERAQFPVEKPLWTALAIRAWLSRNLSNDEVFDLIASQSVVQRGCIGVKCAAMCWFGKTPSALSPAEAASLVTAVRLGDAVLRHSEILPRTRDLVLKRMFENGAISRGDLLVALEETCPMVPTCDGVD